MADENLSPEQIAEMQKKNCIFCKIIKGEIPSRKVFEDDKMLAILDINPAAKGHTLVMPKEHYPVLPVIPPELQKHMFRVTRWLMKGIRQGAVCTGSTVYVANGAVAGQQSPHFLYHIIPRMKGDSLEFLDNPKGNFSTDEANRLTPALKANVTAIMNQAAGKTAVVQESKPSMPVPREPRPHISEEHKQSLASLLQANSQIKEFIIKDPEGFKDRLAEDPDLASMFQGINIDKLSKKLKELDKKEQKEPVEHKEEPRRSGADLDAISGLFTRR